MSEPPVETSCTSTSTSTFTSSSKEPAATTTTINDHLIPLATPCVYYIPNVLLPTDAQTYYKTLHQTVSWEKTSKINRWVALYEDTDEDDSHHAYKYRDAPPKQEQSEPSQSISSNPTITKIKAEVETLYQGLTGQTVSFNTCLLNFYENGNQRIGWHSDREEIGRSTPIASVSLGATRTFLVRHKLNGSTDRASIDMEGGSVIFMENICQEQYVHSVPKQVDVTEGRINLTFRCKMADMPGEEEHDRRDRWLERITADAAADNGTTGASSAAAADEDEDVGDLEEMLKVEFNGGGSGVVLFGDDIRVGTPTDRYDNVRYSVSCNIGTERQCAAEIVELLDGEKEEEEKGWDVVARPWGVAGYVACLARGTATATDVVNGRVASILLQLRSALNVMEYHDHFVLEDVAAENNDVPVSRIDAEMLYVFYKRRLEANPDVIPALASAATGGKVRTFRVTTDRIGDHAFKSNHVEYEMGGACSEVYHEHCKPKMTDYDVNLRIDVVANRIMIGTQLNVEDLSKRHFLRYRNSVTIKTNLAFIMLRLAGLKYGGLLIDPFCGSGTIALEALEMSDKRIRCIGLDVSRRAANGASENARSEGYGTDVCEFHCADARGLRRHVKEDQLADAIVSNLPWGVRTGHNQSVNDLQQMYETFLRCSWYILKDRGRIVILVLRGLQLVRILRKLGGRYRILKCQVVRTTNNLPCILVIEKVSRDLLYESVKGQLSYMSQFVNVSKEMYQAINNDKIDEGN